MDAGQRCQNLYRFIRLRVPSDLSDREIARRWGMPWRSFMLLKNGRRQPPKLKQLEVLATVLEIDPEVLSAVTRGVDAARVDELLHAQDLQGLARLMMARLAGTAEIAEDPYRLTIERVTEPMCTLDVDRRLQRFNTRFTELVEHPEAELQGHPFCELLEQSERRSVRARLGAFYRDGEGHGMVVTLDGPKRRRLELAGRRILLDSGASVGLQMTVRDITEREARESTLVAELNRLRSLVQQAPLHLSEVDLDGRLVSLNYTMLGEPGDRLVGASIFDNIDRAHHDEAKRVLANVGQSRRPSEFIAPAALDGVRSWFHSLVAPLEREGELVGYCFAVRPVPPPDTASE